ncbi:hypothetical protein BG011_009203 [Mortierella polycephala]|uniref:Fe2OG dioxygenase domain-containing protein n=1 Tax=Mortierella polycephala TaxID=41804 RepID=A0A9P6TWS4_9FUNG|nr:hypothetical protein BG011_009203 [Mortierella polycephala]
MGKAGKDRKRRRLLADVTAPDATGPQRKRDQENNLLDPDHALSHTKTYGGVVSDEDMATTLRTLLALEQHTEIFRSKSCKALRAVVHQLQQTATATTGMGQTPIGRISDALVDGRWNDAMSALEEMRQRKQIPKLGALQRWVRDCDAASAKSGAFGDPVVLRVLDSMLRTVDPSMVPKKQDAEGEESHPVRTHPMWQAFRRVDDNVQKYEAALAKTLFTEEEAERYRDSFKIVSHQKGPLRRTPNLHDFTLYLSNPGTIRLCYSDNLAAQPPVQRIDMPHVPGAFLLKDVLTRKECLQMISAAEAVGFTPDVPIVGTAAESVSVLAHNFFWMADDQLLTHIFDRCKAHFPETSGDGQGAVGINSRWRVYRYVPGAIYRIHVDGQWPGSGLDPVTGEYLYDAYGGTRWSRLTFLVYLNDEFEGGGTTFFTPSADVGFMDARAASPRAGGVLCFPHGEAAGSLLHEGSPVLQGAKYIIRADVLYAVPLRS